MIENSFVINLPERADRIEAFFKEIRHLPTSPVVINGIRYAYPRDGIAKAHMGCIEIAKAQNLPYILIMEDDVQFPGKEKTWPFLQDCLSNTPKDWDVLLGGIYEGELWAKEGNWRRIEGEFCALHFYIVNFKAYNTLLSWPGGMHYDRWMNTSGLKCYVTDPMFAIQRPGFSDNIGSIKDYAQKLSKFRILGLERFARK